jgi:hypothetical protein
VSSITRLAKVAGSALLVVLVLPRPAGAVNWCTPDTAKEAYNAILAAAPDGSELETEAKELADDRRADGEFDTEETLEDLDDLAFEHDYLFDCDARIYRYAPDEAQSDDEDAEDVADDADEDAEDVADDAEDESPAPTSPTTARPAPRPVPTTPRPAPARPPAAPAPAPASRPAAQPVAPSSGSGSYAYSYNYSYPNRWAPTATPAPAKTAPSGVPTPVTSAPLVKPMPTPNAAVSAAVTDTMKPASNRTDRRLFLIPGALGIALGVECIKRWAHRARRF